MSKWNRWKVNRPKTVWNELCTGKALKMWQMERVWRVELIANENIKKNLGLGSDVKEIPQNWSGCLEKTDCEGQTKLVTVCEDICVCFGIQRMKNAAKESREQDERKN